MLTTQSPGVVTLTTASADLYSTPAGGAVIRSIHVCNITTSVATFNLAIARAAPAAGNQADTNTNCSWWQIPVSPGQPFDWSGFMNLTGSPVDIIRGLASANSSLTITINGIEF